MTKIDSHTAAAAMSQIDEPLRRMQVTQNPNWLG